MKKKDLLLEERYYDAFAREYSRRRKSDFIWEIPEKILLLKIEYFPEGAHVIDMGCGPAISISNILGKKLLSKLDYVGIDISKEMLKIAKKNIPHGHFIHGNISNPRFKKMSADVIVSLGALHHVENKVSTLRNWASLLKPGAFILLREPTYEVLKKGKGESPTEEGVKFKELLNALTPNCLSLIKYKFFSTPAFHLINRILIKIGLSQWQKYKILWVLVTIIDILFANSLGHKIKFFKGGAFILVLQKNENTFCSDN